MCGWSMTRRCEELRRCEYEGTRNVFILSKCIDYVKAEVNETRNKENTE